MGVAREASISAQDNDQFNLSLRETFQIVRKYLGLILLVTITVTGVAVFFSLTQTPVYEASTKILVGQERGTPDAPREDAQNLQRLTQTMTEAIQSRTIADTVIQQLDLQMTSDDFIEEYLSVRQIPETQLIEVDFKDSSPQRAAEIANTVGDVFSEEVSQVSPSASAITATAWERAEVPTEPTSPNVIVNASGALLVGLMLGLGLAFVLEYLDDSWRSPEEAEQITGVPTFGVIPFKSKK